MRTAAVLAGPAIARLVRSPRSWLAFGGWFVVGVAFAASERIHGATHGADRVLLGPFGGIVLPLLAYTLVGAVLGGRSLAATSAPLVGFGAPPAGAAVASLAVAIAACSVAGAATAVVMTVSAHGAGDPPIVRDTFASAYAAALGGVAYGAWFGLGATFGRGGGGRFALLLLDWILDATGGAPAVVCPRSHVRNLLGGAPPLDLPERASAIALVILAACYASAAVFRATRSRD
jgi:hypothetical protein